MIGSQPDQTSIEHELIKFEENLSARLGKALTDEMNSWLKNTISLIEKDPKLGTVLFTNL